MKKLFLFFVIVFAVNMVLAQSSGNEATIDQFGENIAKIKQIGDGNKSDIDQGDVGSPVINNKVPSYLNDSRAGAYVTQDGNRNRAVIDVDGSNNGSDIYQLGNRNSGIQNINTSGTIGNSWLLMGVDLDQIGDDNYALQFTLQNLRSAPVKRMSIIQNGNANRATQLSVGGYQNITQIGNNNNNPTHSGNMLDVSITGIDNPLDLPWTFLNKENYTLLNDNTQYSNQEYGKAHIYVEGNNNNTYQYQEFETWGVGGRNIGSMDIAGSDNDIIQGQKGDYNISSIDIDGDDNIATSSQRGGFNRIDIDLVKGKTNNVVAVQQVGEWHSASVFQDGNSNTATVNQHD